MHLATRNVNTAFRDLVSIFLDPETGPGTCHYPDTYHDVNVLRQPSRNGQVLRIDEPVTITYGRPLERVLFNQARDANPFFHLYEALWMLAGRNDVASLAYYCKRMTQFSDNGTTLNGAYGYRWRRQERWEVRETYGKSIEGVRKVDQLDLIVAHLKADPNSRRAVLQMWNVEDDLLKIDGNHAHRESKDVCCNLSVMFSIRQEHVSDYCDASIRPGPIPAYAKYLDITVTNRSNDLVWGLLGSNYVTFTILQEYMAARLGVAVGRYHHFTNNLHVYDDPTNPKVAKWKPREWLGDEARPDGVDYLPAGWAYAKPFPLVKDPTAFELELPEFVQRHSTDAFAGEYSEPFLMEVAQPMCLAYHRYKQGDRVGALRIAEQVKADDWKTVCYNWINKRVNPYGVATEAGVV